MCIVNHQRKYEAKGNHYVTTLDDCGLPNNPILHVITCVSFVFVTSPYDCLSSAGVDGRGDPYVITYEDDRNKGILSMDQGAEAPLHE